MPRCLRYRVVSLGLTSPFKWSKSKTKKVLTPSLHFTNFFDSPRKPLRLNLSEGPRLKCRVQDLLNSEARNPVNITLSDAFNSVKFDSVNKDDGTETPTYVDYYFALDGPTGKYFKADTSGIEFRLYKKVPGPDPLLCASEIHTRTPDGHIELGDICRIE